MRRIAAWLLLAGLCAPAPVWAEDEPTEAAPAEASDASDDSEDSDDADDADDAEERLAGPVETHWYDALLRNTDIGFDLLIVRPLAGVTAAAGAALFVPAVIMTAPNGKDSMKDAYERFVREPGEYFATRPLGEF